MTPPRPSDLARLRKSRLDLITIVEAAYRLDLPEQAWLQNLLGACGPWFATAAVMAVAVAARWMVARCCRPRTS